MRMKMLLGTLGILISTSVLAGVDVERYREQTPTQQLVLTDKPCKVFPNPDKNQLYKAYALNIPTSEQYEGCWEVLPDTRVHIEIIISDEHKVFEFYYPQSDFELRPSL